MTEDSHATRNGLICASIFAACYWLAWPIAEMGFWDDWSYAKSAQIFAETGHLTYNGWGAPMLGWQVVWGSFFIRLFGFSFTVLKLSTFPIAILTLILFHAILVRFGITARNAIIGTLTLGLSPLFLPLSASFMTEIYGEFAVVLCLYCCQRAVSSGGTAQAIAWLSFAAASSVVGGTARQAAWLGALVMAPSAGWLLRKRRGVLLASLVLWGGSVACVFYCVQWLAKQPYALGGMSSISSLLNQAVHHIRPAAARDVLGLVLCLLLLVYPVLAAWLPEVRKIGRVALIPISCLLLAWTWFQWRQNWNLPWARDFILKEFSPSRIPIISADPQNFFLSEPARLALSLLIAATVLVLAVSVSAKLRDPEGVAASTSWREISWLLAPFCLSYFVLLFLYANDNLGVFDRYLPLLMPFAIVCLIRLHQQCVAPDLPRISVLVLIVYAFFAIAGTHDMFAWQRARLVAIDEVRSSGVPRTAIGGGVDYDGWTQLESSGYVNSHWITNPPNAYQSQIEAPPIVGGCKAAFTPMMPAVRPKFAVGFGQAACLLPSNYPPVTYLAWLPPFHRAIDVQEIQWLKQ